MVLIARTGNQQLAFTALDAEHMPDRFLGNWDVGLGVGLWLWEGPGKLPSLSPVFLSIFASGTAAAFGQCALSGPLCNLEAWAAAAGDFTAEGNA